MTLITFQDGNPVMRDGKVGTEQECCCDQPPSCDGYCFWLNYEVYSGQPAGPGGWYLYQSHCMEDCDCADPSAKCGAAPAPPPDNYASCSTPCVPNQFP